MTYTKNHSYIVPSEMFLYNLDGSVASLGKSSASCTETFTGDFNPRWRDQVRAGSSATTIASGVKATLNPGFLDCYVIMGAVDPHNTSRAHYGVVGIPSSTYWRAVEQSVPSDVLAEVTNRAISKFLDAADSARSSIEFGQDLGEWKETVHGLIHPLKSLREFTLSHLSRVTKLAKGVKHRAALSKMIADTWLEFKFGWFPLAADVGKAFADFSNNRNHVNVQSIRASARGSFHDFVLPNSAGGFSFSVGVVRCDTRVTGYYYVTFKGAIRTGAHEGALKAAQMLQLDLPHFVPTAWDLLPYSWIADYFVNVGDTLRALCFRDSDLTWGNKTIRTEHQYDWNFVMDVNNYDKNVQYIITQNATVDNPFGSVVSFQRAPLLPGDLIPSIRFSLPLGSEKPWENMAALMIGKQSEFNRVAKHLR
jgi:hypothetical protein